MTGAWPPTGITLRSWSDYLLQEYPLEERGGRDHHDRRVSRARCRSRRSSEPPDYDPATDPLQPMIDVALPMLSRWTCLNFVTGEDIPDSQEQLATLALTLTVEQLHFGMTADQRTTALTSAAGNLRSISAGPWSESYFAPGEVKYAWNVIVADPLLNSMLMALITPECLANRMGAQDGQYPPGYATQEIDWSWPRGYSQEGLGRGGDWLP